ncbi:FecCD family ABC transporter permease [Brevibacterium album]|uniref:FecCD family ABC transporter permease n=1 Tax=Brevibacterium album TaxID=417948 RepID=UPI0003F683C1|nr:iron ABC transporter permease [Brevibacterium album]
MAERRRRGWTAAAVFACAALGLFLAVVLSFALGARALPPAEVAAALLGIGDHGTVVIVGDLRFDRTVAGLACGIALGLAGVLMQALTRNPLADPGLLGVNVGAALGVVIGIAVLGSAGSGQVLWFALLGAGAASAAIVLTAGSSLVSGSPVRLVLAGVAFGGVLSGVTQLLVLTSERILDSFRFWQVGSLAMRSAAETGPLLLLIGIAAAVALLLGPHLNVLALGEDTASSLGVSPVLVRTVGFGLVTVLCAAAVAIAGPIAFIGLVSAHLARLLAGPDLRVVLPLALLLGPCLVLASDVLGRLIGGGAEIPVGIVAAFLGAPALMALLLRGAGGGRRPRKRRSSGVRGDPSARLSPGPWRASGRQTDGAGQVRA